MILFLLLSLLHDSSAHAAVWDDSEFRQALSIKKGIYLAPGAFSGGDRSVDDFHVSNIRIGTHPEGYDRIVIDIDGNDKGNPSVLAHAPLFHIENQTIEKRVIVTLYGKPKLRFSMQQASLSAKKTKFIHGLEFYPALENDQWMWAMNTNEPVKVEAFELSQPARIIIDLKK